MNAMKKCPRRPVNRTLARPAVKLYIHLNAEGLIINRSIDNRWLYSNGREHFSLRVKKKKNRALYNAVLLF